MRWLKKRTGIAFLFVTLVLYQKERDAISPREYVNSVDNKTNLVGYFPSYLKQPPTCKVNDGLSTFITNIEIGWENNTAPDWLNVLCPEVVAHYNKFPNFREYQDFLGVPIPIQSTNYAAQAVCTAKLVKLLAASIHARVYLHAGSHLGALIHGSPIPWVCFSH